MSGEETELQKLVKQAKRWPAHKREWLMKAFEVTREANRMVVKSEAVATLQDQINCLAEAYSLYVEANGIFPHAIFQNAAFRTIQVIQNLKAGKPPIEYAEYEDVTDEKTRRKHLKKKYLAKHQDNSQGLQIRGLLED